MNDVETDTPANTLARTLAKLCRDPAGADRVQARGLPPLAPLAWYVPVPRDEDIPTWVPEDAGYCVMQPHGKLMRKWNGPGGHKAGDYGYVIYREEQAHTVAVSHGTKGQ